MRPYTNSLAAATPSFPLSSYTPIERKNRSPSYAPITEAGTVPGAANAYTVELDQRIAAAATLTVTTAGTPLVPVPWEIAPGPGEVAVNFDLPLLRFHGSLGPVGPTPGAAISVTYKPLGTVSSASHENRIQREIKAVQDAVTALPPSGISTLTGDTEIVVSGTGASRTLAIGTIAGGKIIGGLDGEALVDSSVTIDKLDGSVGSSLGAANTAVQAVTAGGASITVGGTGTARTVVVSTATLADIATGVAGGTGAVDGARLTAGTVTTPKLATDAVTSDKLSPSAVTTAKLADASVTTAKLSPNAVVTAMLADASVTTAKLADASVTAAKLAAGVTADIATGVAGGSGAVDGARLTGIVEGSLLALDSVPKEALSPGTFSYIEGIIGAGVRLAVQSESPAAGDTVTVAPGAFGPQRTLVVVDMSAAVVEGAATMSFPGIGPADPTQVYPGCEIIVARRNPAGTNTTVVTVPCALGAISLGAVGGSVWDCVTMVAAPGGWYPAARVTI